MQTLVHVHSGLGGRLATFAHASVSGRSWLVNDAGAAQVQLPQGDAQLSPTLLDAGNTFVIESDATPQPWVGFQAKRYREDGQHGTLFLTELPGLLGRRFTRAGETYEGGAGAILRQAVTASQRRLPLPLQLGDMRDTGAWQSVQLNVQSLLSLAQQLATAAQRLWWLDVAVQPNAIDASLRWGARRGRSRLDLVLEEGRTLASEPTLEDLRGQPLDRVYAVGRQQPSGLFLDRPQAQAQGTGGSPFGGEALVASETLVDEQSALQAARAAVGEQNGLRLDVATSDTALWREVQLDDVLRVVLGARWNRGQGLDTTVKVLGLQPDEPSGLLRLVVEVLEA